MASHREKTIGPDPWIGFVPANRPKPVFPPENAHYIRAKTGRGVTQQVAVLGLELITVIEHNPNDFEYGAWAVPIGDETP
jgi:hypothetical protein